MSPSELAKARHTVRAFLGTHVSGDDLSDILLCLQEAMKNALRFAANGDHFHVAVSLSEGCVRLTVRDHGVGFDGVSSVVRPGEPGHTDPFATYGRGLFLIGRLMDELELSSEGGAKVRMLKRLP